MKIPWFKVFSACLLGTGVAIVNKGNVSIGVMIMIVAYDWLSNK